ncbi:Piso0_005655 [Millerozyma farinosa CBS 7064]|uniref:Piso0_005655 protein n=1 Tax=Pichia sorbitophila (strain ATCC MYA-4447 / BCRC 22081 / CBS 7064 / NBRC 10061 / NRRL Y-12695) TaxID=559304 RepID=G8XZK7_PICSO|nr:Piso0_005655 [Millerozyma farinosa CBS 7064]
MKVTDFLKDNFVPRIPRNVKPSSAGKVEAAGSGTELLAGAAAQSKRESKDGKNETESIYTVVTDSTYENGNMLHRSLRGRHVQLLGIGATIGSALFVAIGKALVKGGPLNLLLGFLVWSIPILCITLSTAEMVTYLPITSPFVRMAGRCCDEALEIMTAWNFWFLCCAQIPFEVTTVNSIIHFWRDDYSPAIPLAVQVALYFIINIFGVAIYGETEFWLSLGKVILATGLLLFTFIVMVGGNPKHDPFGFRYWNHPGPMAEYDKTGSLGRFEGFLQCLIQACFTFAGPEYIASVASETINPRKTLPSAFKQVFFRLSVFFIGGALSVGILVAYNDPKLLETLGASKPGAGGSPYVIAMQNLSIKVLPDIMNVLLITAAFSAGNSYTYCSSRTLYGVALDGYAPKFLTATTKTGIPMYCVMISLCWALLSFLQLGATAALVLDWIINLITSCQLINFTILCFEYLFFYRALKAQGIDRNSLPFKGWYQPWLAVVGGTSAFVMIFVSTYSIFQPGNWDIKSFLFSYLMIFVDIAIYVGVKLIKRPKWVKPEDVDLVTGLKEVEQHERQFYAEAEKRHALNSDGEITYNWYQRVMIFLFGSEL